MLNLKFKLTPFWLFIILLAVLIISIVIGINTLKQCEGFVHYSYSSPTFFPVNISGYKNPLIKLYDNIFFDKTNGNLVRVYGGAFTDNAPKDEDGHSLTSIEIYSRREYNNSKIYTKDASGNFPPMDELISDKLISSYGDMFIENKGSNHVFYSMWDKKSFIHIIDNDTNIATFLIDDTKEFMQPYPKTKNSISINEFSMKVLENEHDMNNGKYISDSNNVIFFQFTPNVLFNKLSGRLYVKNEKNGNYDSYDRKTGEITSDNNKNESVQFNSYTIELSKTVLAVVMSYEQNTVIMGILKTPSDPSRRAPGSEETYKMIAIKFDKDGNAMNNSGQPIYETIEPVKINKAIINYQFN